ncbi:MULTISPECIES: DUF1656 domain-containing protein [Halomonas]|uniref:DUF1656 domain-containing protein n=1 Tax=Halomonas halophila TaxID=29573 RepID=A0ABQ0U7T5_9GAMM|nr:MULTISPECIES: DUF1656 domain-containing protein [Halomonas]MDR5890335.1 DUF1656 domain-containing protein [Halomonas salina]RAH38513.1 DUF1656 domain-containing protein [Halomonas sp. SL1]WJY08173.1 DUF1656 domain-containing protein [Halomonas halophila]GEK73783.1 hypothetical protein HHA04nite_23270 [Halomonas halophila]
MGLREIAVGGLYLSPLLVYALLGFGATLLIRAGLYRLLGANRLWYEAWFDTALFVIFTAVIAYLSSATGNV